MCQKWSYSTYNVLHGVGNVYFLITYLFNVYVFHSSSIRCSTKSMFWILGRFPNGKATMFAENVFRLFDKNSDGRIDFRELITSLGILSKGNKEEKLKFLFSLYDIDGNGFINRDEMRCVLRALVRIVLTGKAQAHLEDIIDAHMTKIFMEVDINGDEVISLKEFLSVPNTDTVFLDILEKGVNILPR